MCFVVEVRETCSSGDIKTAGTGFLTLKYCDPGGGLFQCLPSLSYHYARMLIPVSKTIFARHFAGIKISGLTLERRRPGELSYSELFGIAGKGGRSVGGSAHKNDQGHHLIERKGILHVKQRLGWVFFHMIRFVVVSQQT